MPHSCSCSDLSLFAADGFVSRLGPADVSPLQGAVRLLCSHILQLLYLLILLTYLIVLQPDHQEAARPALPARLLPPVLGGSAQPQRPPEAALPHLRSEGLHF